VKKIYLAGMNADVYVIAEEVLPKHEGIHEGSRVLCRVEHVSGRVEYVVWWMRADDESLHSGHYFSGNLLGFLSAVDCYEQKLVSDDVSAREYETKYYGDDE